MRVVSLRSSSSSSSLGEFWFSPSWAAAENEKARLAEAAQEGANQNSPKADDEEEGLSDTTRLAFGELQFGRDYDIKY